MMIDKCWIWKDLEGIICGLIQILSLHFPGGTPENHEESVRILGVPVEIRTGHFPNDRYFMIYGAV
jgi:hypothetical protein